MDRLASIELFTRIVDRRSFAAAASDMQVSRPVATATIKALETRLGVRLLQRSTRHVAPTPEGEAYYQRCVGILNDLEDADRGAGGAVSGLLKVDVAGNIARKVLLPRLPTFLARYPSLNVHLGEGERFVDLLREGFDCVIRAGEPVDSGMIIRRLGEMHEVTCASPGYLAEHGVPTSPETLDGHVMVGFVSSRTGRTLPLEFLQDGRQMDIALPARILVSNADTSVAAALLGLGLIQAPRHRFTDDLASGSLVEVLHLYAPEPTPISILYPSSRQLSPRVRVFIDWAVEVLDPYLKQAH
jgi:DNA-binding transcriptional LysR family regulator